MRDGMHKGNFMRNLPFACVWTALVATWLLACDALAQGPVSPDARQGRMTPHAVDGRSDCVSCHGPAGSKPMGEGHERATNVV